MNACKDRGWLRGSEYEFPPLEVRACVLARKQSGARGLRETLAAALEARLPVYRRKEWKKGREEARDEWIRRREGKRERERRQSLLRFWRTDRLRKFYRFFICCKDKGSVFAAENWISLTESVLKESKNFEAEVCIFLLLLFSPSAAAVAVSQSLLDSGRSKSY